MKDLSNYIRDEFVKKTLFEESLFVDSFELVDSILHDMYRGKYTNLVFKTTSIKEYFFNELSKVFTDAKIINCNCSLNTFENLNINTSNSLVVFNNVGKCQHLEIIETIKNYKGILIC